MSRHFHNKIFTLIILMFITTSYQLNAQEKPGTNNQSNEEFNSKAVKIFLEMRTERLDHVKKEIQFVNYVRDKEQAEVFIMETTQMTSLGGSEYTYTFIGKGRFENENDTLVYKSTSTESEIETRNGLVFTLKQGLLKYVHKTPQFKFLDISYRKNSAEAPQMEDNWNHWVFNSRLSGGVNGSSNDKSHSLNGSFSADRVTEDLKFNFSVSGNYKQEEFRGVIFNEQDSTYENYKYVSILRSQDLNALLVKSIDNHWSYGAFAELNSSQYSNTDFSCSFQPAIEYNVFPYSVSTRREFSFLYKIGVKNINYYEETIFNKTNETLFTQNISATFELKEQWGSLYSNLSYANYLNDMEKYNLSLYCNLNIKVFNGFSVDISGSYSEIRDQISLRKSSVSKENLLLSQREILTSYNYRASIGFRYTFGSMFSNVVNPRFGGGFGGMGGGDYGDHW